MPDSTLNNRVHEVHQIARALCDLLHEDSSHRLQLYLQYAHDPDATKWNPDLYLRCQLAEYLCKKLETLLDEKESSRVNDKFHGVEELVNCQGS